MIIIKYAKLIDLINEWPHNIDIIKEKYLSLLSELTITTDLDTNIFYKKITLINQMGCIIVAYIDNPTSDKFKIIASGTIIIEPKIIRGGKNVGHVEDIVVCKEYSSNGICNDILEMLKIIARENDCYKIILDCFENLKSVYSKAKFKESGIQMSIYVMENI
jgi:glucosamine-phosphate N-acetyltransferase